MRARSYAGLLALALASFGGVTHADEPNAGDRESARVAFSEGNTLRDQGNVRGALDKYKAAYALAPTPVTALEVGRAEMDLGHLLEAREVLLRIDAMPLPKVESPKSQAARHEAGALASKLLPRIPKITIRVVGPGSGDQTTVNVDGVAIPREALTVARSVNPGRHAVVAIAFGHTAQQSVDLREGESRDVILDVSSFAPHATATVQPQVPVMLQGPLQGAPTTTGSGLVAFNTPDDGHAWTLRDPSGHDACKLPCSQALGFATGWFVARDDGQRIIIPSGLAVLPGSSAQVTPSASSGSPILGWSLFGVGGAAAIASLFLVGTLSSSGGSAAFFTLLLGGTTVMLVGGVVLAFSHGPMLVRTDMGMPIRIAVLPNGIVGTF